MTNMNESGRSMVEMLGVLAIIGVLSVGGIAGYTQAMKKYRANEITAAISMASIFCQTGQSVDAAAQAAPGMISFASGACNSTTKAVTFTITNPSSVDLSSVQTNLGRFGELTESGGSYTYTMS